MNIETQQVEQPATQDEKFFGIKTVIDTDDAELPTVEIVAEKEEPEPPKMDSKPTKAPDSKPKPADDDDDELAEYSENVRKRIGKLTYKMHEAERQQQVAEGRYDEAIKFARQAVQRSQHFENIVTTGEANLVEQVKGRAANFVELSKAEYQKAYETGDSTEIIAAQDKLIQAHGEQREAFKYEQDYRYRSDQQQQQQQYQQQMARQAAAQAAQQPVVAKPTEVAAEWGDKNHLWFHGDKHPDMKSLAYGIHERLRLEGVVLDSPEYFETIDREMREHFPKYKGFKPTDSGPPPVVVAAAERSGGKPPRKVALTSTAVAVAKQLGITPEQYAQIVVKGNISI